MHLIQSGQLWENQFLRRSRTLVILRFVEHTRCLATPRCRSSYQALLPSRMPKDSAVRGGSRLEDLRRRKWEPQGDTTPLNRFRKKAMFPKLWPRMPGQVLFVRCATKDNAIPVIAMRTVSQRVGCINKWKSDQRIPWITHVACPNASSWRGST